jgi:hypothetical protein
LVHTYTHQTSWESPAIFSLLIATFGAEIDAEAYEKKARWNRQSALSFIIQCAWEEQCSFVAHAQT